MEIKQLEYFVAASECRSFNKAAQCLYTSQPNVSKVVSSLEKELGRELFERKNRGIQLMPYGETVREYALSVLRTNCPFQSIPATALQSLSVTILRKISRSLNWYTGKTPGYFLK